MNTDSNTPRRILRRRVSLLALGAALAWGGNGPALAEDGGTTQPLIRMDGEVKGTPAAQAADKAAGEKATDKKDAKGNESEKSEPSADVPTVEVRANRVVSPDTLSPGSVSIAYPDDVKGEHKSLPDLLDQIPGVYVRRVSGTGQYTTASIRGSAPSQVNIYIDGVPFNLASEGAADLSTIPINAVERVEVYRGTTPARFSGAPMGGAINIVTKKPDGLHGSVSAGARSFVGRQGDASLTTPLGDGALLVGINREQSKGNFKYDNKIFSALPGAHFTGITNGNQIPVDASNYGSPVERTRQSNSFKKDDLLMKWQDDNFFAKWAYTYMDRFLPEATTDEIARYADNLADLDSYTIDGVTYPRYRLIRQQKQGQHDLVLGWTGNKDDLKLGFNVSALDKNQWYRSLNNTSYTIGKDWTHYQTRRYGTEANASYKLGDDWAVDQLLELHADWFQETYHAQMSNNTPDSDFIDLFRRYKTNLQGQDTFTLKILDGLDITPIGRVERLKSPVVEGLWDKTTGGNFGWKPSGSINVKQKFLDGWQAFGSYGTFNRYPSFYEMYGDGVYVVPNVDSTGNAQSPLKREFSHNSDVGLGWDGHLFGDFSGGFRAAYFERKTDNEITLYATPVGAKYINSGDTYTHGGEFEGNLAYGKWADLQFAFTRQEGWYQNDGYYYFGGTSGKTRYPDQKSRTLGHPNQTADVRLNLHFLDGDLTTFFELKHTGRNFTDQRDFERSLTTFDTGLHYDLGYGAKFTFGISDLFNQGPKQSLYTENGTASATVGYDCSGLSGAKLTLCKRSGAFGKAITQSIPFSYNVYYPQQGRTFYTTLAWSF